MNGSDIIFATCQQYAGTLPHWAGAEVHRNVDHRFPDGELCVDLQRHVLDATVYVFQTLTTTTSPPDEPLVALLGAIRAYQEYGARSVHAVVPHLAYSRQDRRIPGQLRPITARLVADLLYTSGAASVITVPAGSQDLLSAHYGNTLHPLSTLSFQLGVLASMPADTLIVAPDQGAATEARNLAHHAGLEWTSLSKTRLSPTEVRTAATTPVAGLHTRPVALIDDLISSAGTLAAALDALYGEIRPHRGATVIATHIRPEQQTLSRLERLHAQGLIGEVVTLDTIPVPSGVVLPEFISQEQWHNHCPLGVPAEGLVTT